MSQATLVSIFPYPILQRHPGMSPALTEIPACPDHNLPVCHVIKDYSYNRYILDGKSVTIPVIAYEQAQGMVRTFKKSIFYGSVNRGEIPGLEAFDGAINVEQFLKENKPLHESMIANQMRWYNALIELADNDWSFKKDKRFITKLQVDAAKRLNLDKEWAKDAITETRIQCPACFQNIHPEATICSHCRTIVKPEEYEAKFGSIGSPLAEMKARLDSKKLQAQA